MPPYKTELVKTGKLGDDDIIIAFMGPTGSGKSQIIDTLTGEQGRRAGGSIDSVTIDVAASRIVDHKEYGSRIVLVDTPGFDDTKRTDQQILKLIGEWLKKTYKGGIRLSGIVYVHRITNPRMGATPHRNLLTFAELCGSKAATSVVLATTMWDSLSNTGVDDANKREQDLKKKYWDVMIHHGAAVERFYNEPGSTWRIIDEIVSRNENSQKTALRFQEERVAEKKSLEKTGAGQALSLPLDMLVARQHRTMEKPTHDPAPSHDEVKPSSFFSRFNFFGNKTSKPKAKGEEDGKVVAKHLKTEELEDEDIIIAVMGPTGSGKSTFINIVATGVDAGAGHELESCTSEIGIVKMAFPGSNILFVDTPGFDDTMRSDSDILKMISDWLEITFERKILLSGLLYFHRISDNRMAGTPLKNLRMFEELCGRKSFKNVILTTTMWDEVEEETGAAREEELKSNYWKSMIARDSSTGRFVGTRDSAFRLIAPLLDEASTRNELLLQKELVDLDLKLSETHAGQKLRSEFRHLAKQQQELLRQVREELKNPDNATSLQELMEEYEELNEIFGSFLRQAPDLQVPLSRRMTKTITFKGVRKV